MKRHIKILALVALITLPWMYGCGDSQNPVKIVLPPEFNQNQRPESTASARRFEQQDPDEQTVVQSTVKLSEKYAKLSDEASELRQKYQSLMKENEQTYSELMQKQAELERAQKEIEEANQLIMEMRVELNNWKSDVLGFRDEMREAQITQLQSLQKVLEILGGEVPGQIATDYGTNLPKTPAVDPNAQ